MSKTPERPRDMNQLAKRIVELTTGEAEEEEAPNPNAQKRGKVRAEKLSAERRSEIARKAARTRWNKEG
jgi:hypothetical protein